MRHFGKLLYLNTLHSFWLNPSCVDFFLSGSDLPFFSSFASCVNWSDFKSFEFDSILKINLEKSVNVNSELVLFVLH